MSKKIYVLDTSACLTDCDIFHSFGYNNIIIPFKVLEELDKHKSRQDLVGINARRIIKTLDELRTKGNLNKGVRISKGKGLLHIKNYNKNYLPENLNLKIPDNEILAVAISEQKENSDKKVFVVSRDINMRVKCDTLGIKSENYEPAKAITKKEELYTGFETLLVDEQLIDKFYNDEDIYIENNDIKLYPNQFLMLVSSSNEKKTALARFKDINQPLIKINKYKKSLWGIKPRNKEQNFAFDLLLDPSISIVTINGTSGCGKSLLALAAGLQQTIGNGKPPIYKRMVVSRPIQPVGKDVGFLPGNLREKMLPWLAPLQDNLEYMVGDRMQFEDYIDRGVIEMEALPYIRGRSIANVYIIFDEVQNLNMHELKTIITRVGENTKIVLTGDIEQIDNIYINSITNGLSHCIEKFKSYDLSGHITLVKGERSKTASLAAKIL